MRRLAKEKRTCCGGRSSKKRISKRHPIMHLGVFLAVVATVVPLVVLVFQCFLNRWKGIVPTEWTMQGVSVFARNADKVISVTGETLFMGLCAASISTLVGMAAGRYLCERETAHPLLWELVIMLSAVVPATVCGVGMRTLFLRVGVGNTWWAVLVALVIANVPYCTKIMMEVTRAAGLRFEEEARVLGVRPFKAYFVGTVPLIVPGIMTSLGFGFMTAVNQYFYVVFLGSGSVRSLITTIVMPAVQNSSTMSVASVYCVYFVLFNVVVFGIFQLLGNFAARRVGKNLGA